MVARVAVVYAELLESQTTNLMMNMDILAIRDRINKIRSRREVLVKLLEQPDLGMLRIDVNQALEEMDDLLAEFESTFPANV